MYANSMEELSHILRLQKFQRRKRRQTQERVDKLHAACEIRSRIIRNQTLLQNSLADAIRTGNKATFRSAYDTYKDARELTQCIVNGHEGTSTLSSPEVLTRRAGFSGGFLALLSDSSVDALLRFISNIVYDPEFLVQKFLALDQLSLDHVASSFRSALAETSVFGSKTQPVKKQASILSSGIQESRPSSQLWDGCRHDGLSLLLELVACYPTTNGLSVQERRERTWAKVCAAMLMEKKSGSDKLTIAIMDAFSYESDYTGRRSLENWLMETLQNGLPHLDSSADRQSFRTRTEMAKAGLNSNNPGLESFLDSAVQKLFSLLRANAEHCIIPGRAIRLAKAIILEVQSSSTRAKAAPHFFVTRWLFSSFLNDHIVTPESHGLLLTYYFPETARHRILREVALRAQQVASNVENSWNHAKGVNAQLREDMEHIAALFEPTRSEVNASRHGKPGSIAGSVIHGRLFRSVCPSDIITLVDTLLPTDQSDPRASQSRSESPALHSSATSVSGMSLFSDPALERIRNPSSESRTPDIPLSSAEDSRYVSADRKYVGDNPFEMSSLMAGSNPSDRLNHDVRNAYLELMHTIDEEALSGRCNPVRDAWSLLEVSDESVSLVSPHHASATDLTIPTNEPGTASEDETSGNSSHSHASYLDLRNAVFRLLEKDMDLSASETDDSFVPPAQETEAKDAPTNPFHESLPSRTRGRGNPFRSRIQTTLSPEQSASTSIPILTPFRNTVKFPASLKDYLERAIAVFGRDEDFVNAYKYTQVLERVEQISKLAGGAPFPLIEHFIRDVRQALNQSISTIRKYDAISAILEQQIKDQDVSLQALDVNVDKLRMKMWYCGDVRSAGQYDELTKVVTALRDMVLPTTAVPSPLQRLPPPPLRHKATIRPGDQSAKNKSAAMVVEILAADPSLFGSNKMTDGQVNLMQSWIQKNGIENICKGEERLHRLLNEVSKCISHLVGADAAHSPVLWASELFQRDRIDGENEALRNELQQSDDRSTNSIARPSTSGSVTDRSDRFSPSMKRKSFFNIASVSSSSTDPTDYFGSRSPTLGTLSSSTIWSPAGYGGQTPSSFTSIPSRAWSPKHLRQSISRDSFQSATNVKVLLTALRQSLTELLISDVLLPTYSSGCETDVAFFTGFGAHFVDQIKRQSDPASKQDIGQPMSHLPERSASIETVIMPPDATQKTRKRRSLESGGKANSLPVVSLSNRSTVAFDLHDACQRLLHRFDLIPSPFTKLVILHDLEDLLLISRGVNSHAEKTPEAEILHHPSSKPPAAATQDVQSNHLRFERAFFSPRRGPNQDASIRAFQDLFKNPLLRPERLFLHLQTIASLVPTEVLDTTSRGASFWNATIAAISLKHDICHLMMATADRVIAHHTASRGRPSAAQAKRDTASFKPSTPSQPTGAADLDSEITPFTLSTAAALLTITAKESLAPAQRELATLYLTHPELLPKVTAPMSLTSGIHKPSVIAQQREREREREKAGRSSILTPAPMSVTMPPPDASFGLGITSPSVVTGDRDTASAIQQGITTRLPTSTDASTATASTNITGAKASKRDTTDDGAMDGKLDALTLGIALHWMALSAKGGDALARGFLSSREEIESLPS